MREVRNILGWLGMAGENSLLKDAIKHVDETYNTVAYFADAVKAFIQGDLNAKTVAIENVRKCEHNADILRANMVSQLSEGLFLPPDREDLLHFVKTLDKIADWTNGSARILGFIEVKLPENIQKNITTATELIVRSVTMLKDGIGALTRNEMKKVIACCEEIARLEHDADDQKKTLIESIIHTRLEPTSLLLCFQLAEYLEGVTDKIEDAADFIKVVAIRSR